MAIHVFILVYKRKYNDFLLEIHAKRFVIVTMLIVKIKFDFVIVG